MKRGAPLRRTGGPVRRTPLGVRATTDPAATVAAIRAARSRARSTGHERDDREARAKIREEGRCRVCKRDAHHPEVLRLDAAHTIGRGHDRPHPDRPGGPRWVNPDDVVPLCVARDGGCHGRYDARSLDLTPYLGLHEQVAAVRAAGGIASALRRLTGRDGLD